MALTTIIRIRDRPAHSDHPGAPGGNALVDAFDFKFRNKVVDAAGRIWHQEISCAGSQALVNACGSGVGHRGTYNQYNRFGMLVRQEVTGFSPEIMRYDGSGNMIYRHRYDASAAAYREDNYLMDSTASATHNQLKRITEASNVENQLNILYNADGSRKWEFPDVGLGPDYRETYYYYDGLGRMAGSVERDDEQLNTLHHNPGTCIYDPEGQLVVACNGTGVYLSLDGHNVSGVLYEPQGSGWRYVHGPGIDDPLTGFHRQTTSTETILYYVTDGQGRVLAVADSSGFRSSEYDNNSSIARWRLAGGTVNGDSFNADRMSGGDVPKLSFYRNRAYDQTTGRWTQEDPIGLAGGFNLYQFNGNNPVSLSDPFGLKVCFRGSSAEIGQLRVATEAATGTRIKLDDENCVASYEADGRKGFSKLQSRFGTLVSSEYEVAVRFAQAGEGSRFDPDSKDAVVSRFDATRGTYRTCVGIIGMILGKKISAPFSAASIVAHELIGHGGGIVSRGIPSPQSTAIAYENQYHSAVGEPERCM